MWFNKNLEADVAAYNAAPTATTTKDPDTSYIVITAVPVPANVQPVQNAALADARAASLAAIEKVTA